MKYEIKSFLSGAVLFSLECDSFKVCIEAAVKSGANLSGANLSGANLSRADLSRAYLSGADLSGANHAIHLGYPDRWPAFAWLKENVIRVQIGCHDFTLAEGRVYWAGKDNRREIMATLDYAEAVAKLRGWVK